MIIYGKEKEILNAQKRSLAAWINNTLGETLVDAVNLISKLSTGVILCKLAKCIQEKADESLLFNLQKSECQFQLKYWDRAKRETFFARDNAELFIRWCKSFGVREAVLFESDGLVLQTQPRTVILCLLELSRLASKYGILLPPPFQLPPASAIAIDDTSDCSEDDFLYATTIPSPTLICSSKSNHRLDSGCSSGARSPTSSVLSKTPSPSSSLKKKRDKNVVVVVRSKSDLTGKRNCLKKSSENLHVQDASKKSSTPRTSSVRRSSSLVRTDTISSRLRSDAILCRSTSSVNSSKSFVNRASKGLSNSVTSLSAPKISALDKRVLEVARQYLKDEDKFHRLSEGHYVFGDKNAYVRIVRGNNVVVRIGGGWDTLEHFLCTLHRERRTSTKIKHFAGRCSKIASVSII